MSEPCSPERQPSPNKDRGKLQQIEVWLRKILSDHPSADNTDTSKVMSTGTYNEIESGLHSTLKVSEVWPNTTIDIDHTQYGAAASSGECQTSERYVLSTMNDGRIVLLVSDPQKSQAMDELLTGQDQNKFVDALALDDQTLENSLRPAMPEDIARLADYVEIAMLGERYVPTNLDDIDWLVDVWRQEFDNRESSEQHHPSRETSGSFAREALKKFLRIFRRRA